MTVSGHGATSQRMASLFNFQSRGMLQTERFFYCLSDMKTTSDHFLIITKAEILRAAVFEA